MCKGINKLAEMNLARLDPEIQWVATEMAEVFAQTRRHAGQKFSTMEFTRAFCPAVADLVAERYGVTNASNRLTAKEAGDIGSDALVEFDPDQALGFIKRVDLAARVVMSAAQLRAIRAVQPSEVYGGYWPFGVEGGFCNPHKLSQLGDSCVG
ncbi:hypothetical protein KTD31_01705 [Burkholderia multivorans]|uniref:hypothetical protein n=1 Tax=Burkholderia multivorans TaxID=87883 RepID=UPI001C22F059|nr:hypothetical protein [Burkholderia multivorans]MBU9200118.1 hypothetical protein [Burkholderia multivorans]MDN8078760.1 hypothetical protein [Burkholderia multivorans]